MIYKAFTLLELLVSVAILGILAAVSFAQYAEYKDSAYQATMIGDAKNIMTAVEAFRIDQLAVDTLISISCEDPDQGGSTDGSCEELLPGFQYSSGNCGSLSITWGPSLGANWDYYIGYIRSNYANTPGAAYQLSFGDPEPNENNGGVNDESFRWISKNMVLFNSSGMKWWADCED